MEIFTETSTSSTTNSINQSYLGNSTVIGLSQFASPFTSPFTSPQISPRTMNFNRGGCVCDCECYKRSNYATLAPRKPVLVEKKLVNICRHFSSCHLNGKSCKCPEVFSPLESIEEDPTLSGQSGQSGQSGSPTNGEGLIRCNSFTFETTTNTKN